MNEPAYTFVGIKPELVQSQPLKKAKFFKDKPVFSVLIFASIVLGCIFAELIMTKDPTYMDLVNYTHAPNGEFIFGTDTLGRDIFSMIWYGGRLSLLIGVLATAITSVIAIIYGAVSGLAPMWLDTIMMRFTEILLSIPSLLMVLFIQAILGKPNVISIALVIGLTNWMSMAKIVRTEVRQIRNSEYVIASRCMGGRFFHILRKHLAPNFVSSIMFMVVMNIRGAIVAESTLSFMGIGLPIEIITWGSMLSLSEKALLTGAWWIILIPGTFLITSLMCITNIGNYVRREVNRKQSNM